MGAVTAMIYASSDKRISSACYDSSFCDFRNLAKELCRKYLRLPSLIEDLAIKMVRSTILDKTKLDINKLIPLNFSKKTYTPGFFVHAFNDELISYDHSLKLFENYPGEKSLNVCEGLHNTSRNRLLNEKIVNFFGKYLLDVK